MAANAANQNNVGRCVDFKTVRNQGQQRVQVVRQGWKITGIFVNALAEGDDRYMVRSNFGNGDETDIIFPGDVTQMYDCPDQNNNVPMNGGRKRKGRKGKSRKSRGRKASKRTRKH